MTELRNQLYGWMHNEDLDEETRIYMRHSTGYKLWTSFFKTDQDLLAMLGYLLKCMGREFFRCDGASWPKAQLPASLFRDNRVLEMSEQLMFYGRRAHAMFRVRRTGISVKRCNLPEHLHRVGNGSLKYVWQWLGVLQKVRLACVCTTH